MRPKVVDLFAGAGGLSEGFKKAGFEIAAAYEIHQDALLTFNANHGKGKAQQRDVHCLTGNEIIKDIRSKNVDVVIGGPPCQGFSTYGLKNFRDTRNSLILEYIRLIKELQPNIFVLENVKGLLTLYNGEFWDYVVEELKTVDYDVYATILKASDYGVPQLRERLFIIGNCMDEPSIFPPSRNGRKTPSILYIEHVKKPSRFLNIKTMKRDITVGEAISDLSFLKPGENSENYLKRPESEFQEITRNKTKILYNHQAVAHSKRNIERFRMMIPGKGNDSLPVKLRTNRKSTKKLLPNQLCRTVTSSPEDFVHYEQPRILTIREVARIQTFPDSYKFLGPRTTGGPQRRTSCAQSQQLGNAVPPFLAQAVAEGIAAMLDFEPLSKISSVMEVLNQTRVSN